MAQYTRNVRRPGMAQSFAACLAALLLAGCVGPQISGPERSASAQQVALAARAPLPPPSRSMAIVSIEPLRGVPQDVATRLATGLGSSGLDQQIRLVGSGVDGANLRIKGNLSALTSGNQTLVVHVWDVFDANGTQVHRISGQEIASGTAPDPWLAVDDGTLQRIAAQAIGDLAAWLPTEA